MNVKLKFIDANHCPGAVMSIISGPLGTVLHTGDFRYNGPKMLSDIHDENDQEIDFLYMDNTFSTDAEHFPPQEMAYLSLKKKIDQLRKADINYKFYLYCYTLGKEEMFINLAKDFKTKIKVTKDRYNRLLAIGLAEKYFTTYELEGKSK